MGKVLTIHRLPQIIRSKLFVPGSRPELFEKAVATAADALSFDLEDSVTTAKKADARAAVVSFLQSSRATHAKVVIVRVNAIHSEWFAADVEALAVPDVDMINLPKVESGDEIRAAAQAIGNNNIGILATIETPKGLRLSFEIAIAHPQVVGLQIGFNDFSAQCGIDSRNQTALQAVRFAVRVAAAEAGIAAYDGAFADVKHLDGFRAAAEDARNMGFAGKSCIHPSQVPLANEVFSLRPDQIAHARKVMASAEEADNRGVGAFVVDGRMIDKPILAHARAVVALAERLGITDF